MHTIRYIHEWTNKESNLYFHTVPMVHIGKLDYYMEITSFIAEMNHILSEGINVKSKSQLGEYTKLAKHLALFPQFGNLKYPIDSKVINIDMKSVEFNNELNKLPKSEKITLYLTKLLLGNIVFIDKKKLHNLLELMIGYSDDAKFTLIDPENHYISTHNNKSALDLLITNERNSIIEENISKYIQENKNREFRMDIAIIFGDNHMPYIYRELKKQNYKWRLEKTIEIMKKS